MELNCCNCQSNGKHQGIHNCTEIDHINANHAQHEHQCTDDHNTDRKPFAELVQCDLQRGFPSLCVLDQGRDLSHFGLHAHFCNHVSTASVGDKSAGIHHVLPVCQRHFVCNFSTLVLSPVRALSFV